MKLEVYEVGDILISNLQSLFYKRNSKPLLFTITKKEPISEKWCGPVPPKGYKLRNTNTNDLRYESCYHTHMYYRKATKTEILLYSTRT